MYVHTHAYGACGPKSASQLRQFVTLGFSNSTQVFQTHMSLFRGSMYCRFHLMSVSGCSLCLGKGTQLLQEAFRRTASQTPNPGAAMS